MNILSKDLGPKRTLLERLKLQVWQDLMIIPKMIIPKI